MWLFAPLRLQRYLRRCRKGNAGEGPYLAQHLENLTRDIGEENVAPISREEAAERNAHSQGCRFQHGRSRSPGGTRSSRFRVLSVRVFETPAGPTVPLLPGFPGAPERRFLSRQAAGGRLFWRFIPCALRKKKTLPHRSRKLSAPRTPLTTSMRAWFSRFRNPPDRNLLSTAPPRIGGSPVRKSRRPITRALHHCPAHIGTGLQRVTI